MSRIWLSLGSFWAKSILFRRRTWILGMLRLCFRAKLGVVEASKYKENTKETRGQELEDMVGMDNFCNLPYWSVRLLDCTYERQGQGKFWKWEDQGTLAKPYKISPWFLQKASQNRYLGMTFSSHRKWNRPWGLPWAVADNIDRIGGYGRCGVILTRQGMYFEDKVWWRQRNRRSQGNPAHKRMS